MSTSNQLLLPRPLFDRMVQHALAELPNECCGLLAGVREANVLRVKAWHPLVNEAASPVEYRSEPRSMFRAINAMRIDGHDIVAIYHSHPTSAPTPSQTDLEQHYSTDVVHFIIGVQVPAPLVRGWWLSRYTFEEAEWKIIEP